MDAGEWGRSSAFFLLVHRVHMAQIVSDGSAKGQP